MKLDAYTIVFLWRPADAAQLTEAEAARVQAAHVAFNKRMRDEGHAVLNGPLEGQPDETLRGINVFRTSVEETSRLMEGDPAVQARRLRFEVFKWYLPVGLLGDRPAAQIGDE